MPTFYIIRHGQTEQNAAGILQGWSNSDLTEEGKQQAMAAINSLPASVDLIFCSDLGRAS
ncbi:histidine phosphatase family protein [Candidatus Saccharibacteria bacterium]|nr:histidine phosphatase family protein [Candidatus Saccharibacteria bacterium]